MLYLEQDRGSKTSTGYFLVLNLLKKIGGLFSGLNNSTFRTVRLAVVKIATKMPKRIWAVPFSPYCSRDQLEKLVQLATQLKDDFCSSCSS